MFHFRNISQSGAVAILVLSPEGETLLVIQRNRKNPFWKVPVETRRRGERPIETAVRGAWEELGLNLRTFDFQRVAKEDTSVPSRYRPHIFLAKVSQNVFDSHAECGNEDGDVLEVRRIFLSDIYSLRGFLRPHHYVVAKVRNHLKKIGVAD